MKNLISFNNLNKCMNCNKNGFFCYTPDGGNKITCPLCNNIDMKQANKDIKLKNDEKVDLSKFDDNSLLQENICQQCLIIYFTGCVHSVNGGTDDCYNVHLISEWKDKTTNEVYIGTPKFDDIDDWYNNCDNIEIIKKVCPNYGWKCEKTIYENKGKCELNPNK